MSTGNDTAHPAWRRRVLLGLGVVVLVPLVALLVLQIPAVQTPVVNRVLAAANPWTDMTLSVERSEGSLLWSIRLSGLSLRRADASPAVRIDSVGADWSALALLGRHVSIDDLGVLRPVISARRDSTGAIDLAGPFTGQTRQDSSAWTVSIGRIAVTDGSVTLATDSSGTWRGRDLLLRIRDLVAGPRTGLRVDTLGLSIADPDDRVPGLLAFSGSLSDGTLHADSFRFRTDRSNVTASGTLRLPGPEDALTDSARFHLAAAPLALADIAPFAPSLNPEGLVSVDLTGRGDGHRLIVEGTGRVGDGELALQLTTLVDADSVAWSGSLRVERLDPGTLLADRPGGERVSLAVEADLHGDSNEDLSGTSRIDVTEVRLGPLVGGSAHLDQTWSDGRITTRGRGSAEERTMQVDGWIEPFASPPRYAMRVRTGPLRWEGGVTVGGSVDARIEGTDWTEAADATLTWSIRDGVLGGCPVGDGHGVVRLAGRRVRAEADLSPCDAPVRLVASASLEGRRPWTLRRLSVDGLPVASLLGDTLASRITAHMSGSGEVPAEGPATVHLALAADSAHWGAWRLDSLTAVVDRRTDTWTGTVLAYAGPGRIRAAGSTSGQSVRIPEASFRSLDLSVISSGSLPGSDINGTLHGSIEGIDPRSARGSFDLALDTTRFRDQVVDAADLSMDISGGVARVDGTASLHGGSLRARGMSRFMDDSLRVDVDTLAFDGIDLANWTGSNYSTLLSGSADGRWIRVDDRWRGRLDATLDEGSVVRRATLQKASIRVHVDRDSTAIEGQVATVGGGSVTGAVLIGADSLLHLTMSVDSLDVARFVTTDSTTSWLDGSISGGGRGRTPTEIEGSFDARIRGSWGRAVVEDLRVVGTAADGIVTLDTLRMAGSFGTLLAHGTVPLPVSRGEGRGATDLSGSADLNDIGELAVIAGFSRLASVGATSEFRLRGSDRGYNLSVSAASDGLALQQLHMASVSATLSGEFRTDWSVRMAELRFDAESLSIPGSAADHMEGIVTAYGDSVVVDGSIRFDDRRQMQLLSVVTDRYRHIALLTLDLLLDDADWSLVSPVDITIDEGFSVSGGVLQAGEQRLVVGGGLGPGRDDLYVTATAARLDAVADLLGYSGLGLTIDGALTATGTEENRQINASIQAQISHDGRKAVDLTLASAAAGGRIQIDALAAHADGGRATVQGEVTTGKGGLRDAPVSLDVTVDSLSIGWILPFLDPDQFSSLSGQLSGQVEVRGTFDTPTLQGDARFENGGIGLPTLGEPGSPLRIRDVRANMAFEGSTIRVDEARMRSDEGTATASGTIEMEQLTLGRYDLDIESTDFLAIDNGPYRAWADSDLRLSGSTREPVLSGSVRVRRGDFHLAGGQTADAFEPVQLSDADLLTLERRFGIRVSASDTTNFDFYEALTIESLHVEFERETWLRSSRNPRMDVRFTGSLEVSKRPFSDPTVFGTISVVPERSRIEQFGRKFEIEHGTLTFSGDLTAPQIDMAGVYRVRSKGAQADEVTIRLVANGTPDDLRITFESDPAMDLSDIVSYIATGRPASSSLQFGSASGGNYLSTAAGVAIGPITSLIEDVAGSGLGLDVVEIEQNGLQGMTLTAGKYVSPEFYVSVQQPISFTAGTENTNVDQSAETQVRMEYELFRELLLSLLSQGSVVRVQLRWEHAF